jgi:ribosomal protein S25
VWALLTDALADAADRPANSVTPEEFADKARVSYSYAARVLRDRKDLRSVFYRRNGRRAVCYVPAEAS